VSVAIVLDSCPLGLLCNRNRNQQANANRSWIASLVTANRRIIIPKIADYEVRREFLEIQNHAALAVLDGYESQLEYLHITRMAMRHAAGLWAHTHNTGQQTAHDHTLDGDMILAAQGITLGVPTIVETVNLSRFTSSELWQTIVP
jgi:hypothetical protein